MSIKVSNGKDTYEVDDERLAEAQKDGFSPLVKVSNGKESYDVHPNDLKLAIEDGFNPLETPHNNGVLSYLKKAGSFAVDNVLSPIATAIDYADAPLRQAMAAPAKMAHGNFSGAIFDPFTQVLKGPSKAPTSQEVAEMYGVPREKMVMPIAAQNNTASMMASSYEQNPLPDDAEAVKTYPSAQVGALMDVAVGGEGLNLAAKGLTKATKMAATVGDKIAEGAANVVSKIAPTKSKLNAKEIIQAGKELGINVTPGMLDDSGFVSRLEQTLAKSPSMFGQKVAKAQGNIDSTMSTVASSLTKDATALSPYQVGEKFKYGVTSEVGQRLDPISAVFNDVAEQTKNIQISERSKKAIIRNIENLDVYSMTGGSGKPGQYVQMIDKVQNADQVKTMMTMLIADIKAAKGAEKQVLIGIKGKLKSLEDSSIMRAAIKTAREGGMREATGKAIGSSIVNDLKDARTRYRQLFNDLGDLAENTRIKTDKGPSSFLDAVEDIPSEKVQDKFFNVENNRQLSNLQKQFPDQFELLRQGKLKDIADSSMTNKGGTSTQKFLNQVKNLNPEAVQMLFGNDAKSIEHLKTLQNAIPVNFNPSETAHQMGWSEALQQNVKDIPNYLLYKAASKNISKEIGQSAAQLSREAAPLKISTAAQNTERLVSKPMLMMAQDRSQSAPVFAKDQPTKGPDKWANDGLKKLQEHDSSAFQDPAVIEQLKKSKKGRDLLIKASDLDPGTKAMDKILKQIKSANLNGAE